MEISLGWLKQYICLKIKNASQNISANIFSGISIKMTFDDNVSVL
jgi:hypothetical protein